MPKRREGPTKNKSTNYYYFDSFVGFPPDRKRIRYSLRTKDPIKARKLWEREWEKRWSEYYGIEQTKRPIHIRLSEITEEFIEYERNIKKAKEWPTFESRLKLIQDFWENPLLAEIGGSHLSKLDNHLENLGKSKKTINHYFGILKTMFYYAIRKKRYIGDNPIKEVQPYIVNEKRREYTAKEIERILSACDRIEKEAWKSSPIQRHAKRIALLLLMTGMRVGELINLRWENIQGDKIVLKRTETKQRKEKVIPVTRRMQEIFDILKDGRQSEKSLIIYRQPGRSGRVRSDTNKTLLRKIREYSGVQDFDFHGLRHTAASIMVSESLGKGVGMADIMKVLGHSKIETTMKYVHADFKRMKKAIEILERKAVK